MTAHVYVFEGKLRCGKLLGPELDLTGDGHIWRWPCKSVVKNPGDRCWRHKELV